MIIGDIQPKETVAMIENKIAAMNKPIVDSITAQDVQNFGTVVYGKKPYCAISIAPYGKNRGDSSSRV